MAKAEVTVPLGIPEIRVFKTEINKRIDHHRREYKERDELSLVRKLDHEIT